MRDPSQALEDDELENELEQLQQEQLDEEMLKTGSVPVSDAVHKMPTPANTERKSDRRLPDTISPCTKLTFCSRFEQEASSGGRRRGGRVAQVAG